jgi:hypothetical protein
MFFLLKSLYIYSLSLWVGSVFFFSVVGAPMAFKVFPKEEAGKYTGSVFPKYFFLGYLFGALSLVSFYLLVKDNLGIFSSLNLVILALMNLFTVLNGAFIVPKAGILKAQFYRSQDEDYYSRFLKLHRVSVILNGITMILGLMALGLTSVYLTF